MVRYGGVLFKNLSRLQSRYLYFYDENDRIEIFRDIIPICINVIHYLKHLVHIDLSATLVEPWFEVMDHIMLL